MNFIVDGWANGLKDRQIDGHVLVKKVMESGLLFIFR